MCLLNIHLVWVYDVLPPIVDDSVKAAGHVREVFHPPLVMQADVAAAPFGRSDLADVTPEIREVEQPIPTFALDRVGIVPVVVAFAVGREVDVAAGGPARRGFFVADES